MATSEHQLARLSHANPIPNAINIGGLVIQRERAARPVTGEVAGTLKAQVRTCFLQLGAADQGCRGHPGRFPQNRVLGEGPGRRAGGLNWDGKRCFPHPSRGRRVTRRPCRQTFPRDPRARSRGVGYRRLRAWNAPRVAGET